MNTDDQKEGLRLKLDAPLMKFQKQMKEEEIDIYYIPTNDPHSSEYMSDYYKVREFLSGFTGSAGELVIFQDSAYLWTDGRYFLQAEQQLEGTGIILMKKGFANHPTVEQFLLQKTKDGDVLAYEEEYVSYQFVSGLKKTLRYKKIKYIVHKNIISNVWLNREPLQFQAIWDLELKYSGYIGSVAY